MMNLGAIRVPWKWPLYQQVKNDPTIPNGVEQKEFVVSASILRRLLWHIPAIIACITTGVLLALNFSEYYIGVEVGKNAQETRNIIGALQLASKAHEIIIVSSLASIARQWILSCLINNGTLLGPSGAETSFSNLSLLISRKLWVAVHYCLSVLRGGRNGGRARLGLLVVGPCECSVITPRYDWFHETNLQFEKAGTNVTYARPRTQPYPYIMIGQSMSYDPPHPDYYLSSSTSSDTYTPPQYWQKFALDKPKDQPNFRHRFHDGRSWLSVNTTTALNRASSTRESNWRGDTTFTAVMVEDVSYAQSALLNYQSSTKCQGANYMFVAGLTGIECHTVCRDRGKLSCDTLNRTDSTLSQWCYLDVASETSGGKLRSNQDLVFVGKSDVLERGKVYRLFMTEGRRSPSNERFSESILIVMDVEDQPWRGLMVCSISAALKSVTATSGDLLFSLDSAAFHNYLSYSENGHITKVPPKIILYHENWLDSMHEDRGFYSTSYYNRPMGPNRTFIPRNQSYPFENSTLTHFAQSILQRDNPSSDIWLDGHEGSDNVPELVVGGAYLSLLLYNKQSPTQYTCSDSPREGQSLFPDYMMPEPIENYTEFTYPAIEVYRYVYGFRISTRTAILGVVMLLSHVLFVLFGSIRQCYTGTIIQSWKSIPEYATLCLGSDLATDVKNTCAGIGLDKTLSKVIKIGNMGADHLELVFTESGEKVVGSPVDGDKKYGYLGRKRRRNWRKKKTS